MTWSSYCLTSLSSLWSQVRTSWSTVDTYYFLCSQIFLIYPGCNRVSASIRQETLFLSLDNPSCCRWRERCRRPLSIRNYVILGSFPILTLKQARDTDSGLQWLGSTWLFGLHSKQISSLTWDSDSYNCHKPSEVNLTCGYTEWTAQNSKNKVLSTSVP